MPEMSINASIVDQQVSGLLETHPEYFDVHGAIEKKKALAFVLLCIKTALNLELSQAFDLLTDGGNDFGVDGIHVGEVDDGEFTVTIFQGKYKINDLSGTCNFPENGIQKAINTVSALFDPYKEITLNDKIKPIIEEIRSMVREGAIPNVRVILCNNGCRWNDIAEQDIINAKFPEDQVCFSFFNHDNIVEVLRARKKISDTIQLKGKAILENFNYKRVLIGKIPVTQIAALFDRHDDLLLERNIRRYLGLHSNRVNSAISHTLCSDAKRDNFYFFNNGITVICDQFRYNALQGEDFNVQISGLQIINGGQTCKTIQQTLKENPDILSKLNNTFVLLRIYELENNSEDFVNDITFATNSQNPVDLRDLHTNDEIQQNLELGIKELGFVYKRKREDSSSGSNTIHSSIVAEAVLAIWRQRPHQAKFMRREHFGKLYHLIFDDLNAAQALLAITIFRFVENERKRPTLINFDFLPYSSHYIAMRIGCGILKEKNITVKDITHKTYNEILKIWEDKKSALYKSAAEDVHMALSEFYGGRKDLSLQQLSATFRRGDLIERLLCN